MFTFSEELNYEIDKENYVKDVQELLNELSKSVVTDLLKCDGELYTLESSFKKEYNEHIVLIRVIAEFSKKILRNIKLCLEPEDPNDKTNYEMQLKLLYHGDIKGRLFDAVNQNKKKFTLRNYKIIYNSTPIYGYYKINGDTKISFHSLYCKPTSEPMTEHVVCVDIELKERNFERARSLANNITTEFCNFLSVLLDIGFYEPTSKFVNFINSENEDENRIFYTHRFGTAFCDPELNLLIKDNMNGLCPLEEAMKSNYTNGYFSMTFENKNKTFQMTNGNILSIEKAFSKHKMHRPDSSTVNEYREGIDDKIHFLNQPIKIPKELRCFFRGISNYKKLDYINYTLFRNACRLYNKSKLLSMEAATIEISFLVASLETLSHTEKDLRFSDFVLKYNPDANEKDLADLYSIRSSLFHSGNFSFFEFDFDINPYSDPIYCEFQNKYILYRSILRKAFIQWIRCNVLKP